jgi:inner membrane protein involved in colicin E2 resistance
MVVYLFLWWWPPRHFIELLISNATFAFNFFPGLHESIVPAGRSVGVEMRSIWPSRSFSSGYAESRVP